MYLILYVCFLFAQTTIKYSDLTFDIDSFEISCAIFMKSGHSFEDERFC